MQIIIQGFKARGQNVGKIARNTGDVANLETHIEALKGQLRVGPKGRYEIEVIDGDTHMMRVDMKGIGKLPSEKGVFEQHIV